MVDQIFPICYNTHIDSKGANMQHQLQYEQRVQELEAKGMTRGDAQGVADMEFMQKYGPGWEFAR
jgi:hypothetical protein